MKKKFLSGFILTKVFSPWRKSERKDAFTLAEVFSPRRTVERKAAFTLAEALITVVIIGIIASLTMPALIVKYQQDGWVSLLKKTYIELGHNLTLLQTENIYQKGISNSILKNASGVKEFFETYYDVASDCGTSNSPCFETTYGSISGASSSFSCSDGYCAAFRSGISMKIVPAGSNDYAAVYIDLNGPELPNIGGRDMFTFNIYSDFTIDEMSPEDIKSGTARNTSCGSSVVGAGCFSKILNDNWKMDY